MFQFEVDNAVVLHQQKVLEAALSTNPKTQKTLQKLIDEVLKEVRPQVVANIQASLKSDPRAAAKSVRRIVYKQILGGNLNILNKKRSSGQMNTYEPPRKLRPGQRGGNRVPRGARTDQVMHYGSSDRGWILRMVNSGTGDRMAGMRGGRLTGSRGRIVPRSFFVKSAQPAMAQAVNKLAQLIDQEFAAMFGNSSNL